MVESEEAEEQQEEETKVVEEAPENAVAESPEKDTDKGEDKEAETSILREEPKEVSTEDIAAKALAAVAETEEVPLTAEKKEAEKSEEPAEKPHKRSGLRQSVKGATLAEALKKGMAVANGENPESKALNKSDEDLRVTGQMKIDDILQAWEAKQKDNAEAIEIQKKKDEEILAQKKLDDLTVMEHGGSLPGVSSNLSWSYDAGVGVMVLCNTSGVPVSTIADAAMRMYHGRNPIEDRFVYQETEWNAEKRKAMCGTFRSDEDNNITIFEKDGNLAVKEGETLLRFVPVQEFLGIVRNPDKDGYVRFFENENGEIFAIGYGGRMLPRVKD